MDLHYNESPAAASLKPTIDNAVSWLEHSSAAKWAMQKLGGPINVKPNERLVSNVAGGVLLLNALVRPGILSLLGGLVGGGLLARGVTGHCPIYSALGQTGLEGADNVPSQFSTPNSLAQQPPRASLSARSELPVDQTKVGFGTSTATGTLGKKHIEN